MSWTACRAHSSASTARGDYRFALASANHNDLALVEQLLMDKEGFTTPGDMRYINAALQCPLAWHNDFTSLTPKRAIRGVQLPSALTAAVAHFRQIVEMVNCRLTGESHLQHNHARCAAGFCALVRAELTAHAIRLYLNCLLGKPLLALKPLAMIEHNG